MTYPDPRYFGEGGEISATYRPNGHPAEIDYGNGAGRCVQGPAGITTVSKLPVWPILSSRFRCCMTG